MKKTLLALILVLCLCLSTFVACDKGGNDAESKSETVEKTEETSKDDALENNTSDGNESENENIDYSEMFKTPYAVYEELTNRGYEGSFEDWVASLAGADGKSAYELAIENGYLGTVEEWLNSLVGAPGKDGADGEKGDKGDKGEDGKDGATIKKVEFDDQGRLIITLTDDTVLEPVELPEKEEHVHTFGELMGFGNNEGLTCDKKMYYTVCSECFEVKFLSGTDDSHDYSETYSFDKTNHWYDCSKCDAVKAKDAHTTNDDGLCTVCEQQVSASKGVVYAKSADGTYAEVIDYTAAATKVAIAEEYEGLPVTTICDSAFENKSITSITIPDSVTSIGEDAFSSCSSLENITIPGSVTSIGEDAFDGCSSLASITFGENSQLTSIGHHAFEDCSSLENITIPDSVTSIGNWAFFFCSSLTSVVFGENSQLTSIGCEAFYNCSSLESITIPDSVTSIGENAFSDCSKLIQKENGVSYVDNCVIDFDNSTVAVSLREGTRIISDYAFSSCSKLRSITIPDSVTSIGRSSFSYCDSLTSITIPDSVTSIGTDAFLGCSKLETVYYTGSEEEWEKISIGDWNSRLKNANIIYNYVPEE